MYKEKKPLKLYKVRIKRQIIFKSNNIKWLLKGQISNR
jgi:hypothetical protein